MSRHSSTAAKMFLSRLTLAGLGAIVGCVLLTMPSVGAAESESVPVLRVEEDWVLVLNEPDDSLDAPQFHTVMSPYATLDTVCLQATWNYWDQPDFEPGGVQLHAWEGDELAMTKGFFYYQHFSTTAEQITWTQVLSTNGEVLSFEIANGQSQTWGPFGGENMKLQGYIHVPDLDGYSPARSAANSCVTYGANRVDLLVISEVRYYGASGLLYTDTTPRVIQSAEPEEE